ncbi:MAG TPA: hypothetical protein PLV83_03145 [Bacilli bacterium]|nr:hypothetical protein [Bacilli bacterium]
MSEILVNIVLPVLSILIPVFVTLYTVDNRIKAQNKENHQPYVVLERVDDIDKLNEFAYYLTPIGKNYLKNSSNVDYENLKSENDIVVKLILNNIGYGVATNIKFYDLFTGLQIHGTQASNESQNQKLFTTLDMEATEEKSVQARIINLVENNNEDYIRILCVYRDLNQNIYDFIISINAKKNNHYDFFAYQPSSKSYSNFKNENNKQYKRIIKSYKERK